MSDNSMKDIKTTEVNAQNNNTGDNKKRKNIILIGMPGKWKEYIRRSSCKEAWLFFHRF